MIKSKCEKCGIEKEYKCPSLVKRFCSHKCSNKWKWDNVRKKGAFLNCFSCGKEHWKAKRYLENPEKYIREGVFCSKKCFYDSRRGKDLPWLKDKCFKKGLIPWNKDKKLSKEFSEQCRLRAIHQWEDLEFRKKQMARDFSKWSNAGRKALKENNIKPLSKKGKTGGDYLAQKFLKKIGVKGNAC